MAERKKYANNKCFVFSADGYEEITYTELCYRQEKEEGYKTKQFIPLHGMLLEVTQEQYREFYKEKRRQKYLTEQSIENKDVSIDVLLAESLSGISFLEDWRVDVAAEAVKNILMENLLGAIQCLSEEEQLMIRRRYYDEMTETELAGIYGISQQAVSKRLRKVLGKLKEMLEW